MRHELRRRSMISAALFVCGALAGQAFAHGPLTIRWFTIDGGGGTSFGGTLRLDGTIGQHDASQRGAMSVGTLTLTGGFWAAASGPPCVADYNRLPDSGDILDFLDFIDDFSGCELSPAPCGTYGNPDVNGDTFVDILDFLDFIEAFSVGC